MIKETDIARNVDYGALGFLESHLMHEKNRLGEIGVVEKYKDIEKWADNDYEYNFLCGFINYFANRNGLDIFVKPRQTDKIVIAPIDYSLYECGELTAEEIKELDNGIIPEFKAAGVFIRELGEAY